MQGFQPEGACAPGQGVATDGMLAAWNPQSRILSRADGATAYGGPDGVSPGVYSTCNRTDSHSFTFVQKVHKLNWEAKIICLC